jgi:hypothetical protein
MVVDEAMFAASAGSTAMVVLPVPWHVMLQFMGRFGFINDCTPPAKIAVVRALLPSLQGVLLLLLMHMTMTCVATSLAAQAGSSHMWGGPLVAMKLPCFCGAFGGALQHATVLASASSTSDG